MKASILTHYGDAKTAFSIRETDEPSVGAHQLKIKVEAFGLNFADVMARRKLYKDAPPLPAILGYESVGKVVEQGKEITQNYLGKRVLAFTRFGSYGEYVVTDEKAVIEVEEKDHAGKLLALATQYCTAYYASHIATTIQPGELVLQHAAAGGVGLAMLELTKIRGAKLIGLTSSQSKMEFLHSKGCHDVLNYKIQNYAKEVLSKHGNIDVSFNSVAGKTFKKDLQLLDFGGRLVCYGAAERMNGGAGFFGTFSLLWQMGLIIPVKLLVKSQSLIGVNMLRIADHKPELLQVCMINVMRLYKEGKLNPEASHCFGVNELNEAHELLESGCSIGKVWISR